jgi:rubredoxin
MTPRFKGKPNFDLSLTCPLCGYRISPGELILLNATQVKCAQCDGVFDPLGGRKPLSTS